MKKLICIEGSEKWPEDQILYIEDLKEVINNKRIKRIIIERNGHSDGEDPSQSLELVRIELNQEKAEFFWNSLWQYKFKKYIHVDITEDPNMGIYIVKATDRPFSIRHLVITNGRVEKQDIQQISRITITEQRNNRLKGFLLDDWSIH